MKTTRKLLLALVLVMSILMTLAVAVIPASAASTPTVLYLKPNSNWTQSNARFAAYFFGNGETWVSMTDYNSDGIYEVIVPSGYTKVIFCRMNGGASANNWDNKWNQTGDLTIPTNGNNKFTVASGSWNGATTAWSKGSCADCGHCWNNHVCVACNEIVPFTVVGTGAHLGKEWDTSNTANDMTYANGVYTKVYDNVAAGSYALKVVGSHAWGTAYGGGPNPDNDGNYTYTVAKGGSRVTVTFTASNNSVNVVVCGHAYDNCDDAVCNTCSFKRVAPGHKDTDKNHECDVCKTTMGTHTPANANTHNCEYCGQSASICVDTDKNHECDVCKTTMGTHTPANNNTHNCEYCGQSASICVDTDKNHECDVCKTTMGTHTPANDNTHNCEYCGKPASTCADNNKDHKCDTCGETVSECTAGEAVKENEVPATCVKEGSYELVVYCTVCEVELSRETKTIDKLAHSADCGHSTTIVDGVYYESIVEAIEAANDAGKDITLTKDVELLDTYLLLETTLDLAGHNLTVAGFNNNGHVVDSARTGSLTVKGGQFAFNNLEYQDNEGNQLQVPVLLSSTGGFDTFIFRAPKAQNKAPVETEGKVVIDFRPSFKDGSEIGNDVLFGDENGAADNKIEFKIRVTRTSLTDKKDVKTVEIPVSQEVVEDVYSATNRGFRLTVTGAEEGYTYNIELVIYSCGVTVHNTVLAIIPAPVNTGDDDEQANA